MFAFLQVRSLEKELELHKQHKPKSGRSGRTAVSGWGGVGVDGGDRRGCMCVHA